MNRNIATRLLEINREFYSQFGRSFSATRQRLQPGVRRIFESISPDESVLDLGCGNGNFLCELHSRGHQAALLGVDFSLPLLREADATPGIDFWEMDLSALSSAENQLAVVRARWSLVTMFATLHHIPSTEMRLGILGTVKGLLKLGGKFHLSNWQFMNSEKLKARVQPWSKAGLKDEDVDEGDYLLDWRSQGLGLRYVHHFSAEELLWLAGQVQMKVEASFLSDGENGRLSLYQEWSAV